MDRYHRQTLFPQIGPEGQARLGAARVLLVGCGSLGCVIAEQLVRAGVGTLLVADRDLVELTNLQRQVLFDEQDVKEGVPKAVAAARRLGRINSSVKVEPLVCDVHSGNVEALAGVGAGRPVNLILDGTDSVETRYLLNDISVKHSVPWVYGACVGMDGRVMAICPPRTACLRCVFPEPPAPAELPTCDTAGVLGPLAAVVGALQATAAIQILVGAEPADGLLTIDIWRARFRSIELSSAKRADCSTCGRRRFERLERASGRSTSLCGRDAIQVRPEGSVRIDLRVLETKLTAAGAVERTPYLLRCNLSEGNGLRLTVFADGRAIIHGTVDLDRARSLYARYIGM
jgi:molybdopterin/thiamine biosynthesis adenylyltransferase